MWGSALMRTTLSAPLLRRPIGAASTATVPCSQRRSPRPGFSTSDALMSWVSRSKAPRPGISRSSPHRSEACRPGVHMLGANRSSPHRSEASTPGAHMSGVSTPGLPRSGALISGAYRSGPHRSEASRPGALMPGSLMPGALMSGACRPGPPRLGTHILGAYRSGPLRSEASMPGTHIPGTSRSELSKFLCLQSAPRSHPPSPFNRTVQLVCASHAEGGPEDGDAPSPQPIMDLINGFRASKAMFTAVELGVFEILSQAPGAASVEYVCMQLEGSRTVDSGPTEVSRDGVHRLLEACAGLQLLNRRGRGRADSAYSLSSEAEKYLTTASADSLTGYIIHSTKVVYPLFSNLGSSVLSGGTSWRETFGFEGTEIFKHVYNTPEATLRFMTGMHSFARLSSRAVVSAFDLSPYKVLVDLGGATGALAVAACECYPSLQATVADLPHVNQLARSHFTVAPHASSAEVMGRVAWVDADFFKHEGMKEVPLADLYIMSRILHDWEEARCIHLLKTVYMRLQPGGALLICEMLLDAKDGTPSENGLEGSNSFVPGPVPALLQDLNMLCQTHGRERSLEGYRELLVAAGFRPDNVRGRRTGSYLDVVMAIKA